MTLQPIVGTIAYENTQLPVELSCQIQESNLTLSIKELSTATITTTWHTCVTLADSNSAFYLAALIANLSAEQAHTAAMQSEIMEEEQRNIELYAAYIQAEAARILNELPTLCNTLHRMANLSVSSHSISGADCDRTAKELRRAIRQAEEALKAVVTPIRTERGLQGCDIAGIATEAIVIAERATRFMVAKAFRYREQEQSRATREAEAAKLIANAQASLRLAQEAAAQLLQEEA